MSDVAILGSNINRVKTHNLRAVLLSLLFQEPAYRVNIAEKTSLSTTTITNIIEDLIDLGIVSEVGIEETTGRRRVGRPRSVLRLEKNARHALGVQVGVERYRIAIANLKAEILFSTSHTFDRQTPPEQVFRHIAEEIGQLIDDCKVDRHRLLGVGVGAAGMINYRSGVDLMAANLGWENIPIRAWLAESLNLPVVVDNNVKAMALGEAFFGSGRDVASLAFVYSRAGVGSGIVIESRLLRGADLGAGEIGHMILVPEGGEKCSCGQNGCLETLVSESALSRQAQMAVDENPGSLLAEYWQAADTQPMDRLFLAARAGDAAAVGIVERAAHFLGIALANLVNLLNPEMIVLGGLFAQGQDLFLPVVRKTLQDTAFAGLGKKVKLLATSFGWQAGIVGASALALTNFFYLNPEDL